MMRKYLSAGVLALLLVMSIGTAYADWIPGSINEIVEGDFQDAAGAGTWGPWAHGDGLVLGLDGPGHGWAVYCKEPTQSLLLRQVVDETLNPAWDWDLNWKEIDLMADIRCVYPNELDHPTSKVYFALDWWGMDYNDSQTPPSDPAPYRSAWIPYEFKGYQSGEWRMVNPFANDTEVLRDENGGIQPRWVSVEILIEQTPSEVVWVDNVILTSKCIPEPMSLVLGFMGLGSVAGLRRMFRK